MDAILTRKILEQVQEIPDKPYAEISETQRTPKIFLDSSNGIIKLSGRSMPENSKSFFTPIQDWIANYSKSPCKETYVTFDLEYFNSSSSKMILHIIKQLADLKRNGTQVFVDWYYLEEDEDMLESGKTFEELSDLEFEYICYQ